MEVETKRHFSRKEAGEIFAKGKWRLYSMHDSLSCVTDEDKIS
jgi:hypothetical protein